MEIGEEELNAPAAEDVSRTCCVTGHREIPVSLRTNVCAAFAREIIRAAEEGYDRFLCGFARGADLLFAREVLTFIEWSRAADLIAVLPFRARADQLRMDPATARMLDSCKEIRIVSEQMHKGAFLLRDRIMVAESSRVIALYDGRRKGGTFYTINEARKRGRVIRIIPYPECEQVRITEGFVQENLRMPD